MKEFDNRTKNHIDTETKIKSGSTSSAVRDSIEVVLDSKAHIEKNILPFVKSAYNIILHGAPGTGKTYLAKKIAGLMGCSIENKRVKLVQFHPSFDYTDFVEGLRPVKSTDGSGKIEFERKDGSFKSFCKEALKNPENKYVFIIDEINRGEISKIFGECMFCIDPGYVGENGRVDSQYQNLIEDSSDEFYDGFYRPGNVYIIGTMNDIDRGVEPMDLAMRRRFLFCEIKADDTKHSILDDLSNKADMDTAIRIMDALNREIRGMEELGEDYCIGASYFLKIKNYTDSDKWKMLWNNHLNSLLREYVRGLDSHSKLLKKFREIFETALLGSGSHLSTELDSDKE